ncbi:NADH dehydrogenase [ubiquinone] 1 beta subcomplex subunit 8, mitochondrial-like [Moschus berezovskii]|uniref:NADH dehydrogenase [ubiquinone] 1 beta subcomplex subunit 8, mitochondrial-like n=1 Tax=Moschus berezovskii TaxID=68408 RepID=UPI0024438641|nr:NADH dehydrogenase [ubiquinone] 1 beta subcomplex subunit 8, mitochondrial-like [Moschus berezovskii]
MDSSYIIKDMLQGSYPKTLEEQVATAKKYNIQVEDEEPWLDDGIMGYGNYLKFPDSSQQERDPWCDWDHPDLMLNWGEPRLWDLGVYIRKRVDASSMPVSWNLTCKQLRSFTPFMTFMFWVWGELCHSPAHVWNQSCILKLIGNWKQSAIPPQR